MASQRRLSRLRQTTLSVLACAWAGAPLGALAEGLSSPSAAAEQRLEIIDSAETPWPSVGRVNIAGYRRTFMCTGTLIAPDKVLTAAHCLFNRITGRPFEPNEVKFIAGVRRENFSAKHEAACFRISPGYVSTSDPQLADLQHDVAVIVLKSPSRLPAIKQSATALSEPAPRLAPLQAAGYHRDRRYLPTLDPACKIIGEVSGSWLTDCVSKQGASGGPVFIREDGELKVAAVMSATAGVGTSVVVPRQRWTSLLEGGGCQRTDENDLAQTELKDLAPIPQSDALPSEDIKGFILRRSIDP